ncbi:hypothetical protein Ga0123462_1115 [Mariprofundus ferrinatatus]|uniref:Uncharacterized protein n=1 Tax=Mariprofundus ferrinatatus TaxID=1921087 RepID=A0A2K8L6U8_9PROT|nr:hypothetical protein [Mariprofundus ferrinatatus]ATX81979.1 hypothetical protein Ga0123462_1115 [Mariprofundus ferrinatatus]
MRDFNPLLLRLLRSFTTLFVGGACIGLLHQYDLAAAGVLLVIGSLISWSTYKTRPTFARGFILICGTILTGALGSLVELWGIKNGYWSYNGLTDGRNFPAWLPFAWGFAFVALYRIEEFCIHFLGLRTLKDKIVLAVTLSAILPTWGEIIAINFGVWNYSWDYQMFGVPLLAVPLLVVFHVGIYSLFSFICHRHRLQDPVFGRI